MCTIYEKVETFKKVIGVFTNNKVKLFFKIKKYFSLIDAGLQLQILIEEYLN